nr:enolase C-terminal domain-like protein [Phytoactinopolyspora alkaliphila]
MGWFPRHADRRSSWRGPGADLVWVMISTDDPAVFGIGQTRGGRVTEALITEHLRHLLVGQDALEITWRTEELARAAMPYADGGVSAMGVAACELALWDLSARAAEMPLFRLLGGRDAALPYYLTCADPDMVSDLDDELLVGAALVKVPMAYGPAYGRTGLRQNLDRIETLRSKLPDHVEIGVDCFMSWNVGYATRFAVQAERADLGLAWIEEPLPRLDLSGHAELRQRIAPVRVAGGEHAFGLADGLRLLESRALDVLQADVTWCGGLATARTLAAVASQAGVVFAPHLSGAHPWALHLLAACGPEVLAEVLVGVGAPAAAPRPDTSPGVGLDPADLGFRQ